MTGEVIRTLIVAASLSTLQGGFARAQDAGPLPTADPGALGFSSERLDKMHANLRRVVNEGRASGYVALLAREGKILDWRAYGQRDIAARTPMERSTIMRIHSMTKLVANGYYSALVD